MRIQSEDLVYLRELQEDLAQYFCDGVAADLDRAVSGETYWECVATLAEIKLMELRGEVLLTD